MKSILSFSSVHVETLCKLNEIAKKHNCVIRMYVDADSSTEAEDVVEALKAHHNLSAEVAEEFCEKFNIENAHLSLSSICFELRENIEDRCKYHTLAYVNGYACCNMSEIYSEDPSPALQDWIDNYTYIPDDYVQSSFSYTEVKGFNGAKASVYREGMALKFFGDLVCDYLGEPRIIETY